MTARDVIAQALELSEKATDGPWYHEPYGEQNQNGDYFGGVIHDAHGEALLLDVSDVDGALIAAARTLLPAFAKALGDMLAILPEPSDENPYAYDPFDDPEVDESNLGDVVFAAIGRGTDAGRRALANEVRTAITAALSEVTP